MTIFFKKMPETLSLCIAEYTYVKCMYSCMFYKLKVFFLRNQNIFSFVHLT